MNIMLEFVFESQQNGSTKVHLTNAPLQHIDLVLADHQGHDIYPEIPQDVIEDFNDQMEQACVYEISRFRVGNVKTFEKPIDDRPHTDQHFKEPSLPSLHVYKLTPFEELPMLVGNC